MGREGCCGNALLEGDEECDDGNAIPDDECSDVCTNVFGGVKIFGCDGLVGPSIVPIFARTSKFNDTRKVTDPGFDKWKLKGEFNIAEGLLFDPDTQQASVTLSQDAIIYQATVPPATFEQRGSPAKPSWRFSLSNRDPDIVGGEGWRKGKLNVKGPTGIGPLNRLGFNLKGKNVAFEIDPRFLGGPPHRLRQTVRAGDICATVVVTCEVKAKGKGKGKALKCISRQFLGSVGGAFLETTGGVIE